MHNLGFRLTSTSARATSASSAARFKSRWGTRRLHQRQPLPYPVEQGLGNFLPPEALKVQLEYQDGLLERLNEEVVGMCTLLSFFANVLTSR
jgi:Fe-Mn family superoxide dismutase